MARLADAYGDTSGAGSDYGYLGGGMYVPTPYTPPRTIQKKTGGFNKNVKKTTSSGSARRQPAKPITQSPVKNQTIEKAYTPKIHPVQQAIENIKGKPYAITPSIAAAVRAPVTQAKTGEYAPSAGAEGNAAYAGKYSSGYDTGAVSSDGSTTSTGTGQAVTQPSTEGNAAGNLGAPATTPATTPAATTPDTPTAPTTQDVVVPSALADATYLLQAGAIDKANARALTARDAAKGDYATNFGSQLHNLGYDQAHKSWMANDNNSQYGQSFRGNMEDYGSRGMLYSTGYAEDLANMNQQYNNQFDQLNTAKSQYDTNQDQTYQDFLDQSSDQKTAALTAATARIASKYGVDPTVVNTKDKTSKTVTIPVAASS